MSQSNLTHSVRQRYHVDVACLTNCLRKAILPCVYICEFITVAAYVSLSEYYSEVLFQFHIQFLCLSDLSMVLRPINSFLIYISYATLSFI